MSRNLFLSLSASTSVKGSHVGSSAVLCALTSDSERPSDRLTIRLRARSSPLLPSVRPSAASVCHQTAFRRRFLRRIRQICPGSCRPRYSANIDVYFFRGNILRNPITWLAFWSRSCHAKSTRARARSARARSPSATPIGAFCHAASPQRYMTRRARGIQSGPTGFDTKVAISSKNCLLS